MWSVPNVNHVSSTDHFYIFRYEIWPAQHDSNVRPTPLGKLLLLN